MPKTRRRSRKHRRSRKLGGGTPLKVPVSGLTSHLKHLGNNKTLVKTLKKASSKHAHATPKELMQAKTQLRSIQLHAGQAATAVGKGATKLKSAMAGGKRSRRRRSKSRRSRKGSRKRSRRRRSKRRGSKKRRRSRRRRRR